MDAYAIKVSSVGIEELTKAGNELEGRWHRGDRLPKPLDDAVAFVGGQLNREELAWFPTEAELRSDAIYAYPQTIVYYGTRPSAAGLIFARPSDNTVFYFSSKM